MRVFFALEFDSVLKSKMKRVQQIIVENSLKGNFTAEENFHLTLEFIGEIKENEVEKLKAALIKAIENHSKFNINIKGIGNFRRGNKKILWFGVNNNEHLNRLFQSLGQELYDLGYEREERAYTPHITIGREVILKEDSVNIEQVINFNELVSINKVSLMGSTRKNGKLVYIPIFSIPLKDD
ncbi:RNA 2',3'-cyclic phosphodiesterase [Serpentinicella alkaliphila]|uniref:RNA 2',3'-cyclic phosphodiesterase n=1 Tax=Serpentinicella alkaliphila TaxID=1734049 RepID=A0A4V2T3P2_9FIRM|nr:RNA 2',3'-cyclic phosphodiesterase [Serpentinicella alkaliphila]QUH25939.1 RNA 2',3'-cyclic phosphodiesterase [Serpentinicella alkaliphila]TCQ02044.1 2'-5' RNA ligase [Serpentinicella alkaliphila]